MFPPDNHKPVLTADARTTQLAASDSNACTLKLEDTTSSGAKHVFAFTGQAFAPKKSYVLLFDPSIQQATLEPLSTSYTFNLASRNNKDVSAQYPKIYPKKNKDDSQSKDEDELLFGSMVEDEEAGDPDSDNPYDFRHFLSKEKEREKRSDESDYHLASSPDYRTGTGSAVNTPQLGAANPTPAPAPKTKTSQPASKKRKTATPNPLVSKTKKAQPTPAVRLQRRATEQSPPPKSKGKVAGSGSKIVSTEFVHSSDDSDIDADGEAMSSPPAPARRSPSPLHQSSSDNEDDNADRESDGDGGLEIEVPDARPARRNGGALASLGLGQNLGVGNLRSPSNGPISLASATNSAAASPNPHTFTSQRERQIEDEIDFGDFGDDDGEEEEDELEDNDESNRDIEPMDIGPPARQGTSGHDRKASMAGMALEDDEDDLEKMMMAGLAGGDSSEESEEE